MGWDWNRRERWLQALALAFVVWFVILPLVRALAFVLPSALSALLNPLF